MKNVMGLWAAASLGCLSASPVAAQQVCVSVERLQLVVDAAETVCRRAYDLPAGQPTAPFLEAEGARLGFDLVETVLLSALCLSYVQGRTA